MKKTSWIYEIVFGSELRSYSYALQGLPGNSGSPCSLSIAVFDHACYNVVRTAQTWLYGLQLIGTAAVSVMGDKYELYYSL